MPTAPPGAPPPPRRHRPPPPASRPIRPCGRDERVEERGIVGLLGMPQHAQREPPGRVLERLDRAILGPADRIEAAAEPAEALMVMRFHGDAPPQNSGERALRFQSDVVIGERPRPGTVPLMSDLV